MQNIILCPQCRKQVKADNLGELLCPNCDLRICPKAHIVEGKICPYCGWEDPNYSLWLKAQKSKQQSRESRTSAGLGEIKAEYICPNCGISVSITQKDCPSCGLLGAKYRAVKVAPIDSRPIPAKPAMPIKPVLNNIPRESKYKIVDSPVKRTFAKEVTRFERIHWQFPSLKRFIKPVLASALVGMVITGLAFGGIYLARFINQKIESGVLPPIAAIAPSKTYALSTTKIPETGGDINVVSPSSNNGSFEAGSQVTLTAAPRDCYAFSYWDGVADSSQTITITMDSDKSVTANFRLEDTTPPDISEVKIASHSDISATLTWLTDKPTTSEIEYGKTKEYGLSATSGDELTTNHKVRLTMLQPKTTYYLIIKSTDVCGNKATKTQMLTTMRKIPEGTRIGERAPDFTLPYYYDSNLESPNKGNKTETLSAYIGNKKVMLNFWNTFCGACIGEFPLIRETYEDKNLADRNSESSDFAVLTICIDTKIDEAPERIEKLQAKYIDEIDDRTGKKIGLFTFPILLDAKGETKEAYSVWTIPETVFIDTDGIIREIKNGRFQNKEEIEAILNSLD